MHYNSTQKKKKSPEADRQKVRVWLALYVQYSFNTKSEGKLSLPPMFTYLVFDQPCVGSSPQQRTPFVAMLSW